MRNEPKSVLKRRQGGLTNPIRGDGGGEKIFGSKRVRADGEEKTTFRKWQLRDRHHEAN